jgi:hypothetical protein
MTDTDQPRKPTIPDEIIQQVRAGGSDLVLAALERRCIPYENKRTRIVWKMRQDERTASTSTLIPTGATEDFGSGWKGDAMKVVGYLWNLDLKRQFREVVEVCADLMRLTIPGDAEVGVPVSQRGAQVDSVLEADAFKKAFAALQHHYGLAWSHYEKYGCEFQLDRAGFTILYPVRVPQEAKPVGFKLKSVNRTKGKRKCWFSKKGLPVANAWFGASCEDWYAVPLIITGGEEKALAVLNTGRYPAAISLLAGEKPPGPDLIELIQDKRPSRVVICFDADDVGREQALHSFKVLREAGVPDVRVVEWPLECRKGYDLNDVLLKEGARGIITVLETATRAEELKEVALNLRRPIVDSNNEGVMVAEIIDALAKMPGIQIYQRAGVLVHVVDDIVAPQGHLGYQDQSRIVPINPLYLRSLISSAAVIVNADGEEKSMKTTLVGAVSTAPRYPGISPIMGIVESPTLRPDGSILQQAGYDVQSGLLSRQDPHWPKVPEYPNEDESWEAVNYLKHVLDDFPFEKNCDRHAWMALVLTLVGRYAIAGPTPFFMIQSNVRGSGKSLLADVAGIIATGQQFPRFVAPSNDDEWRKRITAVAMEGRRAVLIDNIYSSIGSPSLDAALTSSSWSDRILGSSTITGEIPLNTVWVGTGNNVKLKNDLPRRTLSINLDSREEFPEERENFKIDPILPYIRQHRRKLLVAALTILRRPFTRDEEVKLKRLGSFDAWSKVVRTALVTSGVPDFIHEKVQYDGEREHDEAVDLIVAIGLVLMAVDPLGYGKSTGEIIELAQTPYHPGLQDRPWKTSRADGPTPGS